MRGHAVPDPPQESGWARRRANISAQIELAALELCLEHGIDNVTVEQIATAAGISRRTLYRYFRTLDDILVAFPKRALQRTLHNAGLRPLEEGIRDAIVNANRATAHSPEDVRIIRLGMQISRQSPDAWWRAMGRMQPSANEVYSTMIADRLKAMGRDPSLAPLIAAAVLGVVSQLATFDGLPPASDVGPGGLSPERLGEALKAVGRILDEA